MNFQAISFAGYAERDGKSRVALEPMVEVISEETGRQG